MALLVRRLSYQVERHIFGSRARVVSRYISITSKSNVRSDRDVHPFAQLPETYEMLQKTSRDFAENVLKPIARDIDKNHMYPSKQVNFFVYL